MSATVNLTNRRLDDDEFETERQQVLARWPTGAEVDLEDAFAYHRTLLPSRNSALVRREAARTGIPIVQPRAGYATLSQHTELLQMLQDEGQANIVPSSIDSYTRTGDYASATDGIVRSEAAGDSLLNGYPVVSHGVAKTRQVVDALRVPVFCRANQPDLRLIGEIAFAGGHTGFSSGPLFSMTKYSKNVTVEQSIRNWQYVWRLMGKYYEAGIPIVGDVHGSCADTLTPHSILGASMIIEGLIMLEQGAKCPNLMMSIEGSIAQDVAAHLVLPRIAREYFTRYGHPDAHVTVTSKHWSGRFPEDSAIAFGLISVNSVVAALGRADEVGVKTVQEGVALPTKKANAESTRCTKYVVRLFRAHGMSIDDHPDVVREGELIEIETRAILDRVFELGEGDVVRGAIAAFATGVIDIPFSPSRMCANRVLVARDSGGAIRFVDHGNIPLPPDVVAFHRDRLRQREVVLGHKIDYDDLVKDLFEYASDLTLEARS